ncbi:MAG: ABC transporter ATP-binding protein [Coriobacteriales bacterium]|nr:ABC transporter ATP-binding protein [Coriobacteriales bacterium]
MSTLEARHITFAYSKHDALAVDDVSFVLEQGKTLGIVGASGSGKSTLAQIVGGLLKPTQGQVFFDGRDLFAQSAKEKRLLRRSIQFIFQDPLGSMEARWKVGQIIREPLDIYESHMTTHERDALCCDMLERVGLDSQVISKRAYELSGGQCQRVAIARALVLNPRVLICDECTSALDVLVQAQILNLLHDIQDEVACSYVFIGHNIAAVANMSHDILVMHKGSVVEHGDRNSILMNAQHAATKDLLKAAGVQLTETKGIYDSIKQH